MTKRTRIVLLVLAICLLALCLTACSSNNVTIENMTIDGDYRTAYIVGEDLDFSGMNIVLSKSDGSTQTVALADVKSEVQVLNVDMNSVNNNAVITVKYQGQTATFKISVAKVNSDESNITVIFDLNVPTASAAQNVFEERKAALLSKITAPDTIPVRTGYAFDGWYKDSATQNAWNFNTDQVTLTSADTDKVLHIYAKWTVYCEITFVKINPDGTETEVATKYVKKGGALSDLPAIPINTGEEKYSYAWDYSSFDSITQDLVIKTTAPVLKTYTVTFCDTINNATQTLLTLNNVPYGTDLLAADTVVSTTGAATVNTLDAISALAPNNKINYYYSNAWDFKNVTYSLQDGALTNPMHSVIQNMELYAHYEIVTNAVRFDLNYEAAPAAPDAQVVAYNSPIVPVTVSRAGYDFDGWYKEAACTNEWNFNNERVTSSRTLYAKWTKLFDLDFYALYMGDAFADGADKQPALDGDSLADYKQNGIWTVNGESVYDSYDLGAETENASGVRYSYLFVKNTNNIAYTRVLISSVSVRSGETATDLPSVYSEAVSLTGYTAKWSQTLFTRVTSDLDVYAIYTIRTYTVKFIDGTTQIGNTQTIQYKGAAVAPDTNVESNSAQYLAFTSYVTTTRTGYTFNGWNSDAYLNVTEDLEISATFVAKTYKLTITYYAGSTETRTVPYGSTVTLTPPTRDNFDFDGWYTSSAYTVGTEWSDDDTVTGTFSLFAKWVECHTVTFIDVASGATLHTRTVRHGEPLTDIPSVPEVEGKDGVWRQSGAEPNFNSITADITVSASYTTKSFEVVFQNGGNEYYVVTGILYDTTVNAPASPVDPAQTAADDGTLQVGYTFGGWVVSGVSGYIDFADYKIKADTTFIADYSRRTFDVLFVDNDYDAESGTGTVLKRSTVEYESEAYAPANPSQDGKDFIGWSSTKTASSATPNDYKSINGNTIVYALYKAKEYTVNFKSSYDNRTWATIKVTHGNTVAYPATSSAPSRIGYTFDGWDFDMNTAITANTTIYAKFDINVYTISFNTNGGSAVEDIKTNYNTYVTAPAASTYAGMAFLGWYTNPALTTEYVFGDETITSDLVLYAKWSEFVSGFGDIEYDLSSDGTYYTVVTVNQNALAVQIDNFYSGKPVEAIGSNAFQGNTRLQVVILPNTLKTIGVSAFEGCTALQNVTLPMSVTTIGDNAFSGCRNLKSFAFEAGSHLTAIGNNAFSGNAALRAIDLPAGVKTLGSGVFSDCTTLGVMTVPSSVIAIGANAFSGCGNLQYATFENETPCTIGINAFNGVTKSFRIYVSDVLSYTQAWKNVPSAIICSSNQITADWYYEIITVGAHAGQLKLMHYLGNDTEITVPESLNISGVTRSVYSLGDYLFDHRATRFNMNSDMALSQATFGAASNLSHLQISMYDGASRRELLNSNMTYVRQAFESIDTLTELSISAEYTMSEFFGNQLPPSGLKTVNILDDSTAILDEMFLNCLNVTKVTLPYTIETIGGRAFYGCYNLASVSFWGTSQLTSIGDEAFYNCTKLTTVDVPALVTSIGSNAFKGTPFVEQNTDDFVILGDGILYAYNGADEVVVLPSTVKVINEYAFYGNGLRTFVFEEGSRLVSIGDYAFAECSNLEHAVFPESAYVMGDYVFYNDNKLAKLIFLYYTIGTAESDLSDSEGIFTNVMSTLEIYIMSTNNSFETWTDAVRYQLGNNAWDGLKRVSLVYSGDWVSCNTGLGVELLQYVGKDKDIIVPEVIDVDGTDMTVLSMANYVFPRNLTSLSMSVNITLSGNTFGGLTSLKAVTLTNVDASTFTMDKTALYNMFAANKRLSTLNVGGKMSIRDVFGGQLPPSSLTKVNVAAGETELAAYMFNGCEYITEITLPSTLSVIGSYAFDGSGWEKAYDSDFVVVLKDLNGRGLLVSYKGNDRYIVLPDSVKSINSNVFTATDSVEVVVASNIEAIDGSAFANAKALSKIIIKGATPSFGTNVFDGLMEASVLYVDEALLAEYQALSLSGVTVAANNTELAGDYLIATSGSEATIVKYFGSAANVVVPAAISGYTVVGLEKNVFMTTVSALTLSAGLNIDTNAFTNLSGLNELTILDTDVAIDAGKKAVFYDILANNALLTKLTVNSGDITVKDLFGRTPAATLKTVEILDGSASIVDRFLVDCSSITSVIIPSSVTTVGTYAFEDTAWFAGMSQFVVILDGYLYKYTGTGANVTVPATVKVVGDYAFAQSADDGATWTGNKFMKTLNFASGSEVTSIRAYAFKSCSLLTKLDIPSTLTDIDVTAFDGTAIVAQDNMLISNGDKSSVLLKYYGTQSEVVIPEAIDMINAEAFINNSSITSVTFAEASRLVMIGDRAFAGCTNLANVYVMNASGSKTAVSDNLNLQYIEDIGKDAFKDTLWQKSTVTLLFGNEKLLLVTGSGSLVLDDSSAPQGFEFLSVSGNAFASSGIATLYVNTTSPLTLSLGSFDTLTTIYVPIEDKSMYLAQWSAYASIIKTASVVNGNYIDDDGVLVYANQTASVIALTDRVAVSAFADGVFDGISATKLVLTYLAPFANTCSLSAFTNIYVPSAALSEYQSVWSGYASKLTPYTVVNGIYAVDGVLYQYIGNEASLTLDGITAIGEYAFAMSNEVKHLHLPNATEIAANAYVGLENTVVTTAASDTDDWASDFAQNVLQVYTDASIVIDGDYVYQIVGGDAEIIRYLGIADELSDLPTVVGDKYVVAIDSFAFAGNSQLIMATVHIGIQTIATDAFNGCDKVVVILEHSDVSGVLQANWDNSVAAYFYNVTYDYDDAGNVYIVTNENEATLYRIKTDNKRITLSSTLGGKTVTAIAPNAFYGCNTQYLVVPADVIGASALAFNGCDTLIVLFNTSAVPEGWEAGWSDSVLQYFCGYNQQYTVNGYQYIISGGAATLIGYTGTQTLIDIPATVTRSGTAYPVMAIAAYAFRGNTAITSVTLNGNYLTTIGDYAFEGCTNLTSFGLTYSLTALGKHAFDGNPWVESFDGDWIAHNGVYYLYLGDSEAVVLDDDVQTVIGGAFTLGKAKYVIITAESAVAHESYAFDGVEYILVSEADYDAYLAAYAEYADIIYTYNVDNGAVYFDGKLLKYLGEAVSFDVPQTVDGNEITEIAMYAFSGASALLSVSIPTSVSYIGKYAFSGCGELVISLGGDDGGFDAMWNNGVLRTYVNVDSASVVIDGVRYITEEGDATVLGVETAPASNRIVLPDTVNIGGNDYKVTEIGARAFENSSFYSVEFGVNVTAIAATAFSGANGMPVFAKTELLPDSANGWNADVVVYFGLETAFVADGDYYVFASNGNATLLQYNGAAEDLTLPETVNGMPLVGIADYAFAGKTLRHVIADMAISNIDERAFAGIANHCVILLSDASETGKDKLENADELYTNYATKEVIDGYTVIATADGNGALIIGADGTQGNSFAIPASFELGGKTLKVKGIASYAFDNLPSDFYAVTIPQSISGIGEYAFSSLVETQYASAYLLRDITADDALWSADFVAVYANAQNTVELNGVTYVYNGTTATVIGGSGSVITIQPTITVGGETYTVNEIASYAFAGQTDITKIYIPATIIYINPNITAGCDASLKLVLQHTMVASSWHSSWNQNGLLSVVLGAEILTTDDGLVLLYADGSVSVVRYDGSSNKIDVPAVYEFDGEDKAVTYIEPYAFYNRADILWFTLAASVTDIGKNAMAGCTNMVMFLETDSVGNITANDEDGELPFYEDAKKWYTDTATKLHIDGDFIYYTMTDTATLVAYIGAATEVTVPELVTFDIVYTVSTISTYAFVNNVTLRSLTLNDCVTDIEADAFKGATALVIKLRHATMPDFALSDWYGDATAVYTDVDSAYTVNNVKYLLDTVNGKATVAEYLGNASTVTLDATVEYLGTVYSIDAIGEYAFYGNRAIRTLKFNALSTLSSVGAYAFYNCTSLSSVVLPSTVTRIGEYAFAGTDWYENSASNILSGGKLQLYAGDETAVIFNDDNVVEILSGAFASSDAAKYVVYLDGAYASVAEGAFDTLTKVLVSEEHYDFYASVFGIFSSILDTYTAQDGMIFYKNMLLAIVDCGDTVTVPEEVDGYTIDTIANNVCKTGGDSFVKLVVPATVTTIGANDFANAVLYFEHATKPAGFSDDIVGRGAYYDVGNIFTVDRASYLIDNGAAILISYSGNATEYTVPTEVAHGGLTYDIKAIGAYAFGNTYLKSVYLPDSIDSISEYAFRTVDREAELIIYTSLPDGDYAWSGQSDFPVYTNVDTVYSQGYLRYILTDNGITVTGYFGEATSYAVPGTLPVDGKAYDVTEIGAYAFYNVASLQSVSVPQSVTYIGKSAFVGTAWLSQADEFVIDNGRLLLYNGNSKIVTISEELNILSIVGGAFLSSTDTVRLVFTGKTPMIEPCENAFDGIRIIEVPDITLDIYKDYIWTDYSDIIIGSIIEVGDFGYVINEDGSVTAEKYLGDITVTDTEIAESITLGGYSYPVTKLGDDLFLNNTTLHKITVPASVLTLGTNVFKGCTNAVVFLKHEVVLGNWASDWSSDLLYVYVDITNEFVTINDYTVIIDGEGILIVSYNGADAAVSLTTMYYNGGDHAVTRIGCYAFYNNVFVTSVSLTTSVVWVGKDAFAGTGMALNGQAVLQAENVLLAYIGGGTEYTITAASNVTEIRESAFKYSNVRTLTIEATTVVTIEATALAVFDEVRVSDALLAGYKATYPSYEDKFVAIG